MDEIHAFRNLGAHRVDQRVVENVVLAVRPLIDHLAEARDPDVYVGRRRAQHSVGKAGLARQHDLRGVKLLAAKILGVERMRVDQDRADVGTAEHGGGGRAGKTTSDNGNVRLPHAPSSRRSSCRSSPGPSLPRKDLMKPEIDRRESRLLILLAEHWRTELALSINYGLQAPLRPRII